MDNPSAASITPIPTALMSDFRRRVAILDFLDAALDAVGRGDFCQADKAIAGAGAVISEIEARA